MFQEFFDWFQSAHHESKKKVIMLLGSGLLVTLLAVMAIGYVLKGQPSVSADAINHDEVKNVELSSNSTSEKLTYELEKVSMAVMNKKGTKTSYAQFSLILSCPDERALETIKMNRAKLLDGVFRVGSQFYLDDFIGETASDSFSKFKKLLLEQYQGQFHAEAPQGILLKEWTLN